jgi:hypothetical protein
MTVQLDIFPVPLEDMVYVQHITVKNDNLISQWLNAGTGTPSNGWMDLPFVYAGTVTYKGSKSEFLLFSCQPWQMESEDLDLRAFMVAMAYFSGHCSIQETDQFDLTSSVKQELVKMFDQNWADSALIVSRQLATPRRSSAQSNNVIALRQ